MSAPAIRTIRPRFGVNALLRVAVFATVLCTAAGCPSNRGESLVVYCAHDAIFSEQVLKEFEQESGIPVSIKFDTEATKSLGLVNLLIAEQDNPRCDVFWNNQQQGTVQLQQEGLLAPYTGPGFARIPDVFKDPDGNWTGFGARLRVYIVNTDRMEATPEAVEARLKSNDLSRVAMAKPLYGTTLTHYTILWHQWGPDRLKAWHKDLRDRGLREVAGNGPVKDAVADGVCDLGWTDTDDFFVAKDKGAPVAMVPVRVDGGATISIPNTVAVIKGTKKLDDAHRLIDYLLSQQTELELSRSAARQVPLGPTGDAVLSDDVHQLQEWARDGFDLKQLSADHQACLEWLKSEYLQ